MNVTSIDNQTSECKPPSVYSPGGPPVPSALLWVALVNNYCVMVFGILGNALVLWCVATCIKTRRPVKVLLFGVFLPVLVICLTAGPVVGEIQIALLTCDPNRISKTVIIIALVLYVLLVQIEQISIVTIAVVRAAAIWAPHRPTLGIRGAVVLVILTCIYATLTSLGFGALMVMGRVTDVQTVTPANVLVFVTVTVPSLFTAAAYIFMIFVIQRNKRRLVASQQQVRGTTTMDQVTRAMLAVFISNLVFGIPHSIYHIMGKQPISTEITFHVIFSMHFMVDPLVYMWFNSGCREKVLSSLRKVIQSMSSSTITPSVTVSGKPQEQQNSPTHMHEDSKF